VGGMEIEGLSESYMDVPPSEPLAIIGSRGCLEISVNQGNAQAYFEAGIGGDLRLKRPD